MPKNAEIKADVKCNGLCCVKINTNPNQLTANRINRTNRTEKCAKNAEIFTCEVCTFTCFKKSNWNTHIGTRKHQILTNTNKKMPKMPVPNKVYECKCGKIYKHASSLSGHKNKCNHYKFIV